MGTPIGACSGVFIWERPIKIKPPQQSYRENALGDQVDALNLH